MGCVLDRFIVAKSIVAVPQATDVGLPEVPVELV
jgi:hypothetical protein